MSGRVLFVDAANDWNTTVGIACAHVWACYIQRYVAVVAASAGKRICTYLIKDRCLGSVLKNDAATSLVSKICRQSV